LATSKLRIVKEDQKRGTNFQLDPRIIQCLTEWIQVQAKNMYVKLLRISYYIVFISSPRG